GKDPCQRRIRSLQIGAGRPSDRRRGRRPRAPGASGYRADTERRIMPTLLAELAHPAVDPTAALHPHAPISVHDTGVSGDLLMQLLLKQLHRSADCTGLELGRRLGLEFSVIEPLLENMRRLHHCEIAGGGMMGGTSYRYRITDAGRRQAHLLLEHPQYSGFAPVPLSQYPGYLE